jgi:hypothetical protein
MGSTAALVRVITYPMTIIYLILACSKTIESVCWTTRSIYWSMWKFMGRINVPYGSEEKRDMYLDSL